MRNKQDHSQGEVPCLYLWYGKHAYKPMEEVMEKWPDYFLWAVDEFLDITPDQASHFKDLYGEEIPPEYIKDVPPFDYKEMKRRGVPYPEQDYDFWKTMCHEMHI